MIKPVFMYVILSCFLLHAEQEALHLTLNYLGQESCRGESCSIQHIVHFLDSCTADQCFEASAQASHLDQLGCLTQTVLLQAMSLCIAHHSYRVLERLSYKYTERLSPSDRLLLNAKIKIQLGKLRKNYQQATALGNKSHWVLAILIAWYGLHRGTRRHFVAHNLSQSIEPIAQIVSAGCLISSLYALFYQYLFLQDSLMLSRIKDHLEGGY